MTARVALIAAVLAVTIVAQEAVPRVEPSKSAPAGKVLEWTSAQGKPYWYRLPAKTDPRRPPNLVLMLHGTGLKWGWAFWNYPIANGQFRGGDVVVAPEGMTEGGGGTFNFTQGKDDAEQIAGLIALFRKRVGIGKVYLYGHSQGAFFAYWFAGEHPELVDGIIAHAGNVLGNVKHPKAAKEKIAIGILHGRADAVVPVDCAFATEKVYKEQGYKKVRLYVVDGLTEQSGHWPLPVQAGEMLAWLDQVSVDTAEGAIEVAAEEMKKDAPDIAVIVRFTAQAERLLKTAKSADKPALVERHAALAAFVRDLAAAHAAGINDRPDAKKTDAAYGPWAAWFRIANRGLDAAAEWQASMRDLRQRAVAQEKAVSGAITKLGKAPAPAFAEAVKVVATSYLAPSYDDLVKRLEDTASAPPKGVRPDDVAAFKALLDARAADEKSGADSAAAVVQRVKERR